MAKRRKAGKDEDELAERKMVILDPMKCKPNMPAWTYFLKHQRACGKECITVDKQEKVIKIADMACAACIMRAKRCPDDAAKVIKLPSNLKTNTTHRYGLNSFKLHGLPMPKAGSVTGLLGCNGTGKSTALRTLAGKLKPNLGNLDEAPSWTDIIKYYRGSDLQNYFKQVLEDEIKVSLKPQMDQDFVKDLKGVKVGDLLSRSDQRQCGEALWAEMDLMHLLDREVPELSGGEVQRVAITLAVMRDANVYMFDEASSFLDVRQRLVATKVIRRLVQEGTNQADQKYVIVVEHDLAVLDYMSDYIHCLYGEPGGYGVVTHRAGLRNGINNFLAGYLPAENMQFRSEALSFKLSQTSQAELKELGLGGGGDGNLGTIEYPAMTKILSSEQDKKKFILHISKGSFTDGECIGLMGENGTGKTTYLQMLAGLHDTCTNPDAPSADREYKNEAVSLLGLGISMSYKRQDYAPKFRRYTKTVRDLLEKNVQVAFTDSLFKMFVLRPLRIEEMMDLGVSTLSGGELQRLAITVCLGTPASVYLFDEPSAGLDCEQRVIVAKVIKRWVNSHLNRTCYVIEHDVLMMSAMADRMILFTGKPGVETTANAPCSVLDGFNAFLEQMDVTFRRDPANHRPRVNKAGSVKDQEQKKRGVYYDFDGGDDD